jgi:hypothetical protein
MLSFSISYSDLIKFSYFADTTERGDRGVRERGVESSIGPTYWLDFVKSNGALGGDICTYKAAASKYTKEFLQVLYE